MNENVMNKYFSVVLFCKVDVQITKFGRFNVYGKMRKLTKLNILTILLREI